MANTAGAVKQEKLLHLEVLRIIAAFFVIFNHTGARGFFLFSQRPMGSGSFWLYLVLSVFCKLSVPLFFAISGALLLPKEESVRKIWKKRIPKAAASLLALVLLHHGWEVVAYGGGFDLGEIAGALYAGFFYSTTRGYGHIWYMYAYLAFLMALPFLRAMVKQLENRHFFYLLVLAVVFLGILPAGEYLFCGGNVTLYPQGKPGWLLESIVLYPCLGYFLEHRLERQELKKALPWLWGANGLGIAATCWVVYVQGMRMGYLTENESQGFHELFVLLNCLAVYVGAQAVVPRLTFPHWLRSALCNLGTCTFGIYLLHMLILNSHTMGLVQSFLLGLGINAMLACLIQCTLVMGICWALTALLRRIPGIRYLLGG